MLGQSVGASVSLVLEPAVSGSLLILIAVAPRHAMQRILEFPAVRRVLELRDVRTALYVLLALGIVRRLNRLLNRMALNNWSIASRPGWQWSGEIAVVTGGCNGIGKALVLGLLGKGLQVVILDVQDLPEDLAKISAVKYWKCNVASTEQVKAAADDIRLRVGHPSILINNAGVAFKQSILETTDAALNATIGVNMTSLWRLTREFLPNMILKDKGHIVTIASVASYATIPQALGYSTTKAAALGFTEGLRVEVLNTYKSPGILTTVVHPMWVETAMTAPHAETIRKGSIGPMLTTGEVAQPVLNQIFSCKGGQVFVPGSASFASLLRALPNWIQLGLSSGRLAGVS
jgi:all-trans-retinol dehydrogenase (NAD+)